MVESERVNRLENDIRALADKLHDNKATERVHARLDRLRDHFQSEISRIEIANRNFIIKIMSLPFVAIAGLIGKDIWSAFGG